MNLSNFIQDNSDYQSLACSQHPTTSFHTVVSWWRTDMNLEVMYQIANGLDFIHRRNEIHRDVKPQNSTFFIERITDRRN